MIAPENAFSSGTSYDWILYCQKPRTAAAIAMRVLTDGDVFLCVVQWFAFVRSTKTVH